MNNITWQRWVTVCVVLVLLGLAADYYFLHILFQRKKAMIEETTVNNPVDSSASKEAVETGTLETERIAPIEASGDNFLKSLKACRPDISSQGVTTPEALLTYLEKSVGTESEVLGGNSFAPIADDKANINSTTVNLKDRSILTLDSRGGRVVSFQLKTDGKTLACKGTSCSCQ